MTVNGAMSELAGCFQLLAIDGCLSTNLFDLNGK